MLPNRLNAIKDARSSAVGAPGAHCQKRAHGLNGNTWLLLRSERSGLWLIKYGRMVYGLYQMLKKSMVLKDIHIYIYMWAEMRDSLEKLEIK